MTVIDPILAKLIAIGEAVLSMPANSSLHFQPLNNNEITPTGCMPWIFKRPGEGDIEAVDPLTALTIYKQPFLSGPVADAES